MTFDLDRLKGLEFLLTFFTDNLQKKNKIPAISLFQIEHRRKKNISGYLWPNMDEARYDDKESMNRNFSDDIPGNQDFLNCIYKIDELRYPSSPIFNKLWLDPGLGGGVVFVGEAYKYELKENILGTRLRSKVRIKYSEISNSYLNLYEINALTHPIFQIKKP